MKQHEATNKILEAFTVDWATLSGGVASVFDNEAAPGVVPYVRLSIQNLESQSHTLGTSSYRQRRPGIVNVKIKIAGDIGRVTADQLAEHVRTIFERKRLSFTPGDDIHCGETSVREVPAESDAQYFVLIAATSFYFYGAG
jgi:hypothetical protein